MIATLRNDKESSRFLAAILSSLLISYPPPPRLLCYYYYYQECSKRWRNSSQKFNEFVLLPLFSFYAPLSWLPIIHRQSVGNSNIITYTRLLMPMVINFLISSLLNSQDPRWFLQSSGVAEEDEGLEKRCLSIRSIYRHLSLVVDRVSIQYNLMCINDCTLSTTIVFVNCRWATINGSTNDHFCL